MPDTPLTSTLKVTIRDRRKIMFDGDAVSLSSVNSVGDFDVLVDHANFVSLIKDKIIVDKDSPTRKVFDIDTGLINVDEEGVNVYVGVGKPSDETEESTKEASEKEKKPKKKGFLGRKLGYFD